MANQNIPKIIHYVWIGGKQKPADVQKNIRSWKKHLPDYKIIEWNEKNFDIEESCDYVKEAYQAQKWAFVSDYIRLYALSQMGGIYFDTDVEVVKNFDDLLNAESFLCSENKYSICTAVIGSVPHSPWIEGLLEEYNNKSFTVNGKFDMLPNTKIIFDYLTEKMQYEYKTTVQVLPCNLLVYTEDYFTPLNCANGVMNKTEKTHAIHHYSNSWIGPFGKLKRKIRMIVTRVIGEDNKERLKRILKRT